jgi:hypothetical protein
MWVFLLSAVVVTFELIICILMYTDSTLKCDYDYKNFAFKRWCKSIVTQSQVLSLPEKKSISPTPQDVDEISCNEQTFDIMFKSSG